MDVESCVNRIWEVVLDSYGSNVEFTKDEVVVYQSAWEKEVKARIRAILEDLGQLARLTKALDTCIAALTKIIEKHGKDWVQVNVIFGSDEFEIAMQALKEACDALGYVLNVEHAIESG